MSLFDADAPSDPSECVHKVRALIVREAGPHVAEERCASCDRWIKWVSKAALSERMGLGEYIGPTEAFKRGLEELRQSQARELEEGTWKS